MQQLRSIRQLLKVSTSAVQRQAFRLLHPERDDRTCESQEKLPQIFISRLVLGGLVGSTGLLAANDVVLEVNGIEVRGKSLD